MLPLVTMAQPRWLNEVTGGLESRHHFYATKWVCLGDTLGVDSATANGIIVKIDGFWMTCDEISKDLWHWYMNQDMNLVNDALSPETGASPEEIESFCKQLNISLHAQWRVPTRQEWLFAYHGGLFSEGYRYSGSDTPAFVAWTKENSGGKMHQCGLLIANELGLHDLSGNAAEMVTDGERTIFLGGSYLENAVEGERLTNPPSEAHGFRLVWRQPLWFDQYGQRIFRTVNN